MSTTDALSVMGKAAEFDRDEGVVRATRKLRQSGNSMVVSLPKEVLQAARMAEGDRVQVTADLDSEGEIVLRRVEDSGEE